MKKLQIVTGITAAFIFLFMVIALFQYKGEKETSVLPDQIEYYLDENWRKVSLDGEYMLWQEQESQSGRREFVKAALENGECQEVKLPYSEKSEASKHIVFANKITNDYAGQVINFTTQNADVCVFLDGDVIYQYEADDERASGKHENFVAIPNQLEKGELWIELKFLEINREAKLSQVIIETRDKLVIGVVGNNIADIGCCLLIIIMAIIMFVLAIIRRYTCQPLRGEFFLGLAGLVAGIYCFIGTDTLSIFYDVQEAYGMQEYLVLLLPLFLSIYLEKNLHIIYPRRFSVLLYFVSINAVVQILLQMAGIRYLEDMVNISAGVIVVVCLVAIVSLIQFDYKNKRFQTMLSVLAMLVLLSGGIANIIINTIFKSIHVNIAGQYSMTVFSIMMAVIHILQLSKEYRANAEERVKVAEQQNRLLIQAKKDADAARHDALAANEEKGKFLARMSHEIRTPINAVLGMDEMILRESKERNIKEYAMDIHMAGQTLLSLINDILDFSKIDSGKMEIVPVEYDFSSLVYDLACMASQRAEGKNIKFEVEVDHKIPSRLYGDDVRIRQVLTNILTNAVKYTQKGTVWFRVQYQTMGDMAVFKFEVEDTGIGIKEEDLPKLSAEFERIEEDRNRNIEGTGLGMSITIQLLELLGSHLQVESTYGKGSKFYFELGQKIVDETPIGDFEGRVCQMAENFSYSAKFFAPDAKILVVDDNEVNRKVLRNLLKETQIQVTEAGGCVECLQLVQENQYDLIFLDHMMPEMDGVETLHHIKELPDCPCQETPIVVLTANAVSGAREKYLEEGFDDFLSKPITPGKLENMIKQLLPGELLTEAAVNSPDAFLPAEDRKPDGFLEELPLVDGLDWQYAWLHLPDIGLLEYTIKEFYFQIDSAADKLEQAYKQIANQGQLEQYRIQVHAMKSLAATVGIMQLSGLAKLLEYAARDGKADVITSLTVLFLEEWRSYSQKLEGVFGIGMVEKKEVEDFSVIQALVEMIRFSMQEMDIDQADQLITQLQEYRYPDGMAQNIQKLAEAVTDLNQEETEQVAELLIVQMQG